MAATALTLRSPGEIAAVVPYLTGFVPHESLVAIGLRKRRVGLTMRIDLADLQSSIGEVVSAMRKDRATACLLVVLTALPSSDGLPMAACVELLERRLGARGIEVPEALLVRAGRWFSYRCIRACCPAAGAPVEPASPSVVATYAYDGRVVLASRAELVESVTPQVPLGPAIAQRLQEAALAELDDRGDPVGELARWAAALDAWEQRPTTLPPADVAALAVGLHLVSVRDAVASWGLRRHDALLGLLGQLCRAVVPPDDAPLCSVLAWVAYSQGNGALARVALERALATDPSYSLAQLLLAALAGMLPPGKVREVMRRAG